MNPYSFEFIDLIFILVFIAIFSYLVGFLVFVFKFIIVAGFHFCHAIVTKDRMKKDLVAYNTLICADLKIEEPTLYFNKDNYSTGYYHPTRIEVGINLYICRYLKHDPIRTLAHELRHKYQFDNNYINKYEVVLSRQTYKAHWMGEELSLVAKTQEEYNMLPWEKDANEYADSFQARLLKGEFNPKRF